MTIPKLEDYSLHELKIGNLGIKASMTSRPYSMVFANQYNPFWIEEEEEHVWWVNNHLLTIFIFNPKTVELSPYHERTKT